SAEEQDRFRRGVGEGAREVKMMIRHRPGRPSQNLLRTISPIIEKRRFVIARLADDGACVDTPCELTGALAERAPSERAVIGITRSKPRVGPARGHRIAG